MIPAFIKAKNNDDEPSEDVRITENDDVRVTMDGDTRITE